MSSKRKQVYLAVAGSVVIHLTVLFAWALAVQWFPAARAATEQPPDEIKLQVVEEKPEPTPPPPEIDPPAKAPRPKIDFVDATDLPEASVAPKDHALQSDRNTEATSEMPPSGDQHLPTRLGRKVPSFAFDTHPYVPGDPGKAVAENMPPPVPATEPPPPRPAATPRIPATPPPATTDTPADPRDLAMVTPKSLPTTPTEPNPYDPSFRPPADMTEPPRPTPVPRRGGFKSQQTAAAMAGNAAKNGGASVASEATPAGRYTAVVLQAIDHRWRQYFDARADLVALGTVHVHFMVDRRGKVHGCRVISNTANEALANISLRAVSDTAINPMPDDVAAEAPDGLLPIEINFNYLNAEASNL